MIDTLKEVREALRLASRTSYSETNQDVFEAAITKLDALIAAQEKAEPQYLSIERVEGFPEKLEQGPQSLLYSDGINGCMVRRDDVWLALTSQLAMPQSAPSTSQPLTDEWIRSLCKETWVFETVKQWVSLVEAAHKIGAKP